MIDLAGSESAAKSGAEGQRLREAAHINASLAHLATVFDAMARKAPHIPFRNSQLTQFLQVWIGLSIVGIIFWPCYMTDGSFFGTNG